MNKFIFLVTALFFATIVKGQTNDLTVEEFLGIEIDNMKLSDIDDADQNENTLKDFFKDDLAIETGFSDASDYWIKFFSKSVFFLFEEGEKNAEGIIEAYELTNISIIDASICLKIKDLEVRIGDSLSILGEVAILTYNDGVKEVVYKLGSQVIEIGFDPETEIITSIKYRYYNT